MGDIYIKKCFEILLGGLVFVCHSLRGFSFSMSQLLYSHPYFYCPFFNGLVERLEHIFIDISLHRQVAFLCIHKWQMRWVGMSFGLKSFVRWLDFIFSLFTLSNKWEMIVVHACLERHLINLLPLYLGVSRLILALQGDLVFAISYHIFISSGLWS